MSPITTLTIVADRLTPVAAYAALRRADAGPSFLLESVVAGERWGRYSILGYRPRREIVLPRRPSAKLPYEDPFAELAAQIPTSGRARRRFRPRASRARTSAISPTTSFISRPRSKDGRSTSRWRGCSATPPSSSSTTCARP